ncbi:hypothetical protein IDH09_01520 [Pelagibacterales bacterium SAG-MED28]|jgi:hypothetical protein|nr:hypothetical protein [Pelagibacterales bacterium SAG-MED28]
MPYIGRGIVSGNFTKLDSITTSATATYALANGGAAFTPQSVNQMIVSLNGVIQAPTDAFTISGSNIVFDSSLTSSDVIDFILVLGDVNDIGVPSDDSISAVKLKTSSVTNKKLADQNSEKGVYGSSSNPITYEVKVITKTAAHPYNGSGSGSGYEIDGVEAPVLKFNGSDTGKKYYYKFDQSDASNSGHPLLFYLKADKTGAYTTNVTATGTPGNAGAFTTIQVDEYTPNILYYQCSSHAYMGNHINHLSNQINTSGTLLKLPTADGTSDQVLTTNGSGVLSFADAGGGGLVHIKTQNVTSGVASVDFNHGSSGVVFDSTYNAYKLIVSDMRIATDNQKLHIRYSTDAGSSYLTSNYDFSGMTRDSNSGTDNFNSASDSDIRIHQTGQGSAAAESMGLEINIYKPSTTDTRKLVHGTIVGISQHARTLSGYFSGSNTSTAAITGFQIRSGSGNIDRGNFSLFGVVNS